MKECKLCLITVLSCLPRKISDFHGAKESIPNGNKQIQYQTFEIKAIDEKRNNNCSLEIVHEIDQQVSVQ